MTTQFGHINLHKSSLCNEELATYLSESTSLPTIIGIQEPHFNPRTHNITYLLSNYLIYDRSAERPRAALHFSSNVHVIPYPDFTDGDMATALWKTNSHLIPHVAVTSIYMPGDNTTLCSPLLNKLIGFCERKGIYLIILADANARHTLWNEREDNDRGKLVVDFMTSHHLKVLNFGGIAESYTYSRDNAKSIIDLSIVSHGLGEFCEDWFVSNDLITSDHRLVKFKIQLDSEAPRRVRNFGKANWKLFHDSLEACPTVVLEAMDVEDLISSAIRWNQDVTDCLDLSTPERVKKIFCQRLHWQDGELTKRKAVDKKAHHRSIRYPTNTNKRKAQAARTARGKCLKRKRRQSWQLFISNVDEFEKGAQLNKILNKINLNHLGILKDPNGQPYANVEDSLDKLSEVHFPNCLKTPRYPAPLPTRTPTFSSTFPLSKPQLRLRHPGPKVRLDDPQADFISEDRVYQAIRTFGNFKAAGPDGFKPCVYRNMGKNAISRLTAIFKASYLLSYTPESWRNSNVTFIPKPGKDSYSDPRSFRPISLMTFTWKIMERLVYWDLQDTVFATSPFNPNQHGFLIGRGCDTALSNMTEYIEEAIVGRKYALGVFLDIQGAFDNLPIESMVQGMRDKGFPELTISWYRHFLENRRVTIKYKGAQITRFLVKGTPQGGVLSPIMWNLGFESLLDKFPDDGKVKIVGFADDAALITVGTRPSELRNTMQTAINTCLKWGAENSLSFAPKKTKAVLFTRKTKVKIDTWPKLKLGTYPLSYDPSVKYLGVLLDKKLYWRLHVNTKIKKAKNLLFHYRNATGSIWGLSPRISVWIYRSIVRPMLTFGSLIWSRVCSEPGVQKSLNKLQRLALMSMGFFRRSTPTAGLEMITYTMPLWLHVTYEGAMGLLRTMGCSKYAPDALTVHGKPRTTGHRQYLSEFLTNLGSDPVDHDDMKPHRRWSFNYKLITDGLLGEPITYSNYCFFTDGSKNLEGHTGAGVIGFAQNPNPSLRHHFLGPEVYQDSWYLGTEISVFQSEVYALGKVAEFALAQGYRNSTIAINCDSQAALQALTSTVVHSKQVHATSQLLQKLGDTVNNNKILLRWVKAHVGHEGNERADLLAKEGADSIVAPLADNIPLISAKSVREEVKEKFVEHWNTIWQQDHPCRQTKLFFKKANKLASSKICAYSRQIFSAFAQFITGHNFLNRHSAIVAYGYPEPLASSCRYCNDDESEESSIHILTTCPAFSGHRFSIFGFDSLNEDFMDSFLESKKWVSKLSQFLHKIKLLDFTVLLEEFTVNFPVDEYTLSTQSQSNSARSHPDCSIASDINSVYSIPLPGCHELSFSSVGSGSGGGPGTSLGSVACSGAGSDSLNNTIYPRLPITQPDLRSILSSPSPTLPSFQFNFR